MIISCRLIGTKPMSQEIYKALLGQGGALILACLVLYNVMTSYEKLITTMVQESKEDREMYIKSMDGMTNHLGNINKNLEKIQEDISILKTSKN